MGRQRALGGGHSAQKPGGRPQRRLSSSSSPEGGEGKMRIWRQSRRRSEKPHRPQQTFTHILPAPNPLLPSFPHLTTSPPHLHPQQPLMHSARHTLAAVPLPHKSAPLPASSLPLSPSFAAAVDAICGTSPLDRADLTPVKVRPFPPSPPCPPLLPSSAAAVDALCTSSMSEGWCTATSSSRVASRAGIRTHRATRPGEGEQGTTTAGVEVEVRQRDS